ncbi:uncharacterized transmembrane protein DDB_G0281039 [Galendromus occidentalis]|uniref:Uncharacterized transmembrane protein DDB_G0281039 n=1 Tax=Galendromus occidentalis TaxID=34638 RepID=A0AAJ7SEN0_9ACAR|nr:uncharacterized transmembrane protein DDB_G0281039 [Galendromus occidentalis]
MQVFNVVLALAAISCSGLVSAKHAKLVIGGAAAGGAGAVGAGGGFLAGSHIGSLLIKHGIIHGHQGQKEVLLPPKHVYLKHHEPIAHHGPIEPLHAAPAHHAPIAIKHEEPLISAPHHHLHHEAGHHHLHHEPEHHLLHHHHGHDLHHHGHDNHHHHHHGHDHHHHEHDHHHHHHHGHEHHHAVEHAEVSHATHHAPIVHAAPIAEHAPWHVAPAHIHHVEHVEHAHHGPTHVKKHEPLYRGNVVIKKKIPAKGHHFSIHGYQFSIGRKPKTLLHKKHFFLHPAPVIVKPYFVKKHPEPKLIKAVVPVPAPIKAVAPIEQGPIVLPMKDGHGPAAGPWAQAPIIINEPAGPIAQPVIKAAAPVAVPVIKEAGAVEGGWPEGNDAHSPILKILGPIFDAPLPVIGGHDAW